MLQARAWVWKLLDTITGNSMFIQLQPQSTDLEQWVTLARKEGTAFEVMEPFSLSGIGAFVAHKHTAQQFRKTGLAASIHGAFIDVNPASGDPAFRELSRQRCRESCEIALAIGARNVVFHSSAFPFLRGAYLENWAAGCASFYEELVEQYPVNLYIENAQDLDPQPLRKLMETVRSDRIGVCLDVGHAYYSRTPISQWFEQLGQWIGYLHLSDNAGSFDDHLPLGQGSIDWLLVHRCWETLGKEIPITLETGNLESTKESIRFLRKHRYFGLEG